MMDTHYYLHKVSEGNGRHSFSLQGLPREDPQFDSFANFAPASGRCWHWDHQRDVTMNIIGTTCALLAVLAASLAQNFTSNVQKEFECNAMQLLYHTSPLIVLQMVVATPMFHSTAQDLGHVFYQRQNYVYAMHLYEKALGEI